MSGMGDDEEEYRGPVAVEFRLPGAAAGEPAPHRAEVRAHLAGHFDPLSGGYRWVGRLAAHPLVSEAFAAGCSDVRIRTPDGHEGRGRLGEPNLWGGHPVSGSGAPPFAVPRISVDD